MTLLHASVRAQDESGRIRWRLDRPGFVWRDELDHEHSRRDE